MSLFHKNCVLTGLLDSYCLVCEVHLKVENDIRAHIRELCHHENLSTASYVEILRKDGIRKVPQGYYCEYCNKLFNTSINVNLHVVMGHHRKSKDNQWLRQQEDAIIICDELAIDGDAYHGLLNGACALCNSEYLDKEAHKTTSTHLLKLVQSSVELHISGAIYRKGDDFFHCLLCNAIFQLKFFDTHFEQSDHIKLYKKCIESFKNAVTIENKNGIFEATENEENIKGIISFNKEKYFEKQLNISGSKTSDILAPTNLQPERTTKNEVSNATEGELLAKKKSGNDTKLNKNVLHATFPNKEQVFERENNLDKEKNQTTEALPYLSLKCECEYDKCKGISDSKSTNKTQVFEQETNKVNKIHSKNFQTHQTIEILEDNTQDPLIKKTSENNAKSNKAMFELKTTYNEQIFDEETNKSNENHAEVTTFQIFQIQQPTDTNTKGNELLPNRDKAKIIAKANKIRYRQGNTTAFCSICCSYISSSYKNIKRHVADATHLIKAKEVQKDIVNVIPMQKFVEHLKFIELESGMVIINKTFCITLLSYLLMTKHHSYIRCHVCEVNFNVGLFNEHRNSEMHNQALQNTSVICSLLSEFVREVQPGYYHCGFCNTFEKTWLQLIDHCTSQSHVRTKSLAQGKLA